MRLAKVDVDSFEGRWTEICDWGGRAPIGADSRGAMATAGGQGCKEQVGWIR